MFFALGIDKKIRVLRRSLIENEISDDLRGYSWEKPPVEPINSVKIAVSDINGFCPTKRHIYLKYVLGEKPKTNPFMLKGLACHKVIKETVGLIKKGIYSGISSGKEIIEFYFNDKKILEKISKETNVELGLLDKLYKFIVIQFSAKVDEVTSKHPNIDIDNIVGLAFPPLIERRIDGRLVGLSKNLSLDVFTPYGVIMDFKTGKERYEHNLALAGYALALEADEETDVNFGMITYLRLDDRVSFSSNEFVISDEIRREFLEIRDEIAEMIDAGLDPGKPENCPNSCAYYEVCHEGCG